MGDHDADLAAAHRGEEQFGEISNAATFSIFSTMPTSAASRRSSSLLELLDVAGVAHEREVDDVGVAGDEVEVGQVLCL